jgi:hypothetical protein
LLLASLPSGRRDDTSPRHAARVQQSEASLLERDGPVDKGRTSRRSTKKSQQDFTPTNRSTMALQAASTALDRASRADAQVKESSWAEMVRNQDRQRKELPWKPTVFVPPTVVSLKERKARERDVDVLTQTFRDPARESMVATSRDAFEAKLLARRDDLKKNRFNIINHDGPPRRIDADPSFALTRSLKDRGKPYNLLSHLQRDDHQAVPLRYLGTSDAAPPACTLAALLPQTAPCPRPRHQATTPTWSRATSTRRTRSTKWSA